MALVPNIELDPIEPEEQAPEYIYEDVDLGGESWNYRLFWNDRAERWQIDLWNSDGTKAAYTIRMVPNYPLGWAYTGRIPTGGYLMLYDTGDPDARDPCTYEGLGHRWRLMWLVDDGAAAASRPWTITV